MAKMMMPSSAFLCFVLFSILLFFSVIEAKVGWVVTLRKIKSVNGGNKSVNK